jgi:hypothetical protein
MLFMRGSNFEVARPHPLFRLMCAMGLVVLLVAAARTMNPSSSSAAEPMNDAETRGADVDAAFKSRGVGTLVGSVKVDGLTVHVFDFSGEQRFTVYAEDGAVLAERVSADELRKSAPQLDPANTTPDEATAEAAPENDASPEW